MLTVVAGRSIRLATMAAQRIDAERILAVALGTHARVGANSALRWLTSDLLELVLCAELRSAATALRTRSVHSGMCVPWHGPLDGDAHECVYSNLVRNGESSLRFRIQNARQRLDVVGAIPRSVAGRSGTVHHFGPRVGQVRMVVSFTLQRQDAVVVVVLRALVQRQCHILLHAEVSTPTRHGGGGGGGPGHHCLASACGEWLFAIHNYCLPQASAI